jgi:hypothetical protein
MRRFGLRKGPIFDPKPGFLHGKSSVFDRETGCVSSLLFRQVIESKAIWLQMGLASPIHRAKVRIPAALFVSFRAESGLRVVSPDAWILPGRVMWGISRM